MTQTAVDDDPVVAFTFSEIIDRHDLGYIGHAGQKIIKGKRKEQAPNSLMFVNRLFYGAD